ncbi:tetratricopeptide repeat protein [Actinokineospora auranticolor]|uniref:Putative ATPase n=1 Tax=Actinokineospora auranticolor TaxID=155976 RepID=A0A2S6GCS2_9PSEU|nr:tetratricopeptide repeat protein [Actinokineospora auranticolor]PPK62739.1 putative ATPase [Actinokineospora auranticolor]
MTNADDETASGVRNTVDASAISGVVVQGGTIAVGGNHFHLLADNPRPTPRQLPLPPPGFVGRQGELAALTAAEPGETPTIWTIGGAGGMGKTSLAVQWAASHGDRFPDGALFVDLHGFSPNSHPLKPAAALRGFLDALGVHHRRVPAALADRTALFRSLVAGKRMLILLDNACDEAQVGPLLPGTSSCTVLVTSRNRLPGLAVAHDAQSLRLGPLTGSEARAMLSARLGADHAAGALLAAGAGHPLALAIIAGLARTHSPAEIADELRDESSRLDVLDTGDPATSLPAVLSFSTRALTHGQRTAFLLLGLAPGPDTGLPAAASLVALPVDCAKLLLRALEHASLVDRDNQGRYRMHDLVRDHARSLANELPARERQDAIKRVFDFYVHTAAEADRRLDPRRTSIRLGRPMSGVCSHPLRDADSALQWFAVEHRNLLATHTDASAADEHETVWRLAWVLNTYQQRRAHRQERADIWRCASEAAPRLTDPVLAIRAYRHLGHAHIELGDLDEAHRSLRRALDLARLHGETAQEAHTHRTLALMSEQDADRERALDHASHALELYRRLGNPVREATALNQVGWLTAWLGDRGAGEEFCRAALALFEQHDDPDGEAHTHDSLGWIAHVVHRHHEAIEHYRRALDIYQSLGNTYAAADTLDRLGAPYMAIGHYEQAEETLLEALTIYQHQDRPHSIRRVARQLGVFDALVARGHRCPEQG